MGYRSDVAYKIEFHDKEQWNVFLLEAKSKPNISACFEYQDLTVDYEHYELRFLAEGVKWYRDYPDVKCHHELLDLCDEYNDRSSEASQYVCSYLFKRIGENEDDVETLEGGEPDWDAICLSRQLVVSWA